MPRVTLAHASDAVSTSYPLVDPTTREFTTGRGTGQNTCACKPRHRTLLSTVVARASAARGRWGLTPWGVCPILWAALLRGQGRAARICWHFCSMQQSGKQWAEKPAP